MICWPTPILTLPLGKVALQRCIKRIQFLASSGAHIIDKDLTMAFTELKILKRLDACLGSATGAW
jgi:hypothetical protein